jgi:hypothetical protein
LLCKEENVRAGRITAAGKMKEIVVVTVHKETMKTMDSSKIMDDRVDNRRIMVTGKKMAEEGCKVDNREVMDNKEAMDGSKDMDSVVITVVNKAATGASMKDMAECRVVSVDTDRKDNMVSRAGMADSKVDTVDMASKAVGVACREASKAAGVECKAVNIVAGAECKVVVMVSKAAMANTDKVKRIMMIITVDACRDAIAAAKRKIWM